MKKNKIYFVGAGPGDPELITVKGARLLSEADLVVYTGSLINTQVLEGVKKEARLYNSAGLTLDEVFALMEQEWMRGGLVVRLHTGDPSLYGTLREQVDLLEKKRIPFQVIPGVSSFTAAAASLGRELTLPGVTQTVICTRLEGRTPVPEKESLKDLASHRASMVIFLSTGMIDQVAAQLREHYPGETMVVVVYKASWKDERIVRGTLEDIVEKVQKEKIIKTALIMVGGFLDDHFETSKLYDPRFSHACRKGQSD